MWLWLFSGCYYDENIFCNRILLVIYQLNPPHAPSINIFCWCSFIIYRSIDMYHNFYSCIFTMIANIFVTHTIICIYRMFYSNYISLNSKDPTDQLLTWSLHPSYSIRRVGFNTTIEVNSTSFVLSFTCILFPIDIL